MGIEKLQCKQFRIGDLLNLKKDIEDQFDFQISFEGIYKWIVFDFSKGNSELPD